MESTCLHEFPEDFDQTYFDSFRQSASQLESPPSFNSQLEQPSSFTIFKSNEVVDSFDDESNSTSLESSQSEDEFPGKAELEMSYSDWSMGLESGTSHWLPAYGFQQPSFLQESFHHPESFNDTGYAYLETIMEETSDDLRSDSEYSGWQDSDSGSVIHIPNHLSHMHNIQGEWSGSERDLAVPKKRRRRQEDDSDSRSSSLLQFETLERHCDEGWARYSDSLDSSSDDLTRSYAGSRPTSLRTCRSYDSLVVSEKQTLSSEFSQSLNDNSLTPEEEEVQPTPRCMYQTVECLDRVGAKPVKKTKKSSENLSEDSGFGEHIPAKSTWTKYSSGSGVGPWQSAPELGSRGDTALLAASLTAFAIADEEQALPEDKFVMESATSTPNLYSQEQVLIKFADSTVSLSRALSFKKNFEKERMFCEGGCKGSNIQMTTSFVSLGSPDAASVIWQEEESSVVGVPESPAQPERPAVVPQPPPVMEVKPKGGRFGSFFQRFSLRRLSGRDKKRKEKKKEQVAVAPPPPPPAAPEEAVRIVPLHGPDTAKPPLIPRRRDPPPPAAAPSAMTTPVGLLETDIDSDTTATTSCSPGKKARSLVSLGAVPPPPAPVAAPTDNRARSMEFLLDKENHHHIQPPENELQKVGSERVMSEHELRVQRSLQKLNLPEWIKNCPGQGFLLGKRNSDAAAHWPGLGSKTTSLSSLGSTQSAQPTPRSPTTGHMLSPSPTPSGGVTRWSTSRLNSGSNSASTSPCGSARSSFNYRQPYLGWRSQERIAKPRTPSERLAADLLPLKQQHQNVPNLSEVHSSIKEVTSAIASYVSKGEERLSPALHRHASSRSASPRGSKNQLCWVESSFVGSKPLEVLETPLSSAPPAATGREMTLDLKPAAHTKSALVNDIL